MSKNAEADVSLGRFFSGGALGLVLNVGGYYILIHPDLPNNVVDFVMFAAAAVTGATGLLLLTWRRLRWFGFGLAVSAPVSLVADLIVLLLAIPPTA